MMKHNIPIGWTRGELLRIVARVSSWTVSPFRETQTVVPFNSDDDLHAFILWWYNADYEEVLADKRRLTRELDVLLNGDGAAQQASLCDIVGQVANGGLPMQKELAEARRLISGVASCSTCGVCSGASRTYLERHAEKQKPPVCEWQVVKTMRGIGLVWAWQPGCDDTIAITDQRLTDKFIGCPFCMKPLIKPES